MIIISYSVTNSGQPVADENVILSGALSLADGKLGQGHVTEAVFYEQKYKEKGCRPFSET